MHSNLYALGGNFGGQGVGGACGVAVHAAVQHNNRLFFGFAAAPQVILANEPAQVLAPHGTVQRGNGLDGQGGGLFQHSLHLHAVLAHNVGVVAAGIVQPFAGKVYLISEQGTLQGTKGAKSIGASLKVMSKEWWTDTSSVFILLLMTMSTMVISLFSGCSVFAGMEAV